jgi:TfoX/Sxy family transcriptional regulator of competence genes
MFGEYGVYLDEVFVGVVCDDHLFFKVTPGGTTLVGEGHLAPAYPGAKPSLQVPDARLEEREWLVELAQTTACGLTKKKR